MTRRPGRGRSSGLTDAPFAELYDLKASAWKPAGTPHTGRALHTASLLSSGKVLFAGGYSPDSSGGDGATADAELFDPEGMSGQGGAGGAGGNGAGGNAAGGGGVGGNAAGSGAGGNAAGSGAGGDAGSSSSGERADIDAGSGCDCALVFPGGSGAGHARFIMLLLSAAIVLRRVRAGVLKA